MGLDCYFQKPTMPGQTAEMPEFPRDISLCGGMFSGHGQDGSFRGKVYDPFITEAIDSDMSLYEERTPEDLLKLADGIEQFLQENGTAQAFHYQYELSRQEIEDLALAFRVFGEAGYGTWAWY